MNRKHIQMHQLAVKCIRKSLIRQLQAYFKFLFPESEQALFCLFPMDFFRIGKILSNHPVSRMQPAHKIINAAFPRLQAV